MSQEQQKEENVVKEVEETMDQYSEELEASFKKVEAGDILTGTVISVSEDEITLDLKYYTEGIIKKEEFSSDPDTVLKEQVQVGEELSATVLRKDDGNGNILLSKKEANDVLAWDTLQQWMDEEKVLQVKVKGVVNAGVIAYVEGIRGFIPASKLSLSYVEDLEEYLLKDLDVKIITVDKEKKKLVLSAKELLREKAEEDRKAMVSNIEVGLVTEGKVETIKPYGAFVNLGKGLSGLVHISQISNKRIKDPSVVLSEGDQVKVKIIGVKDGKISLSMKALEDVAAETIEEEQYEIPKSEEISTKLGDLFRNLKI